MLTLLSRMVSSLRRPFSRMTSPSRRSSIKLRSFPSIRSMRSLYRPSTDCTAIVRLLSLPTPDCAMSCRVSLARRSNSAFMLRAEESHSPRTMSMLLLKRSWSFASTSMSWPFISLATEAARTVVSSASICF